MILHDVDEYGDVLEVGTCEYTTPNCLKVFVEHQYGDGAEVELSWDSVIQLRDYLNNWLIEQEAETGGSISEE